MPQPFHLAIPVHDLAAARGFYGALFGCAEGRSSAEWVDVRRGATQGDLIEIIGPVNAGDTVLRRGSDEIRPGTHVNVKMTSQKGA